MANNTLSQGVIHNQMFGLNECRTMAAELNYEVGEKYDAGKQLPGVKAEVWTCGKVIEVYAQES